MNQLKRTLTLVTMTALLTATAVVGCSKSDSDSDGDGGEGGGGDSGGAGKGGASSGGNGGSAGSTGSGGSGSGGKSGSGGSGGAAGGAGGAAGGTGGSGGAAGAAGGAGGGAGGTAGAGGAAPKMAQATIMAAGGGTITGTVTFVEKADGVEVTYQLMNCPAGMHETHIHAGTGCEPTNQGMHWGPARGEGIGGTGKITCTAAMTGTLTYLRPNTDAALKWTIGGPAETNILTHPVIIHGLSSADRHGCGIIQAKN